MYCFVANSSWYLSNFRSSTLRRFSDIGEVCCLKPSGEACNSLEDINVQTQDFYLKASSLNILSEVMSLFSLFLRLRRIRPRIVFSFNPKTNLYSLIVCRVLGIPCVPNVSGVGAASQLKGFLGKFYDFLVGFFYRRASYVFFQNIDDYNKFVDAGWVDPERAEVIPGSGVDLEKFKPTIKKHDKIRFLMSSRLIKSKGVLEYIEAARVVLKGGGECEFFLAGIKDSSKRAIDENIIEGLRGEENINFLGHVEDMAKLMESVDCVVLPSYYPEGIPRSLIEGAAAGKFIITTDTPGCRDVVKEGKNGILVATCSVERLADAFRAVCRMPEEEFCSMQQASRKLAETFFDEKVVIQRYIEASNRLSPD